jgi:hypothetical protein
MAFGCVSDARLLRIAHGVELFFQTTGLDDDRSIDPALRQDLIDRFINRRGRRPSLVYSDGTLAYHERGTQIETFAVSDQGGDHMVCFDGRRVFELDRQAYHERQSITFQASIGDISIGFSSNNNNNNNNKNNNNNG